jgi:hypothetical protein
MRYHILYMIVQVFPFLHLSASKALLYMQVIFSPASPIIHLFVLFNSFEALARTREEGAGLPCTRFYDLEYHTTLQHASFRNIPLLSGSSLDFGVPKHLFTTHHMRFRLDPCGALGRYCYHVCFFFLPLLVFYFGCPTPHPSSYSSPILGNPVGLR